MGKKKVIQKSKEEVIKENESVEHAVSKQTGSSGRQKFSEGKIFIQSTYNNTIISVTDQKGNVIAWMSAGSLGFSGPKKATPFAASKVAEAIAQKVEKTGPSTVEIYLRGVGSGRDSAVRSFAAKGFNITAIKDVTPIPHNGPKPPKVRRV
ncbi:30S ribosomal protein S11 [Patescibacteria group bacterium]|nr:30S ribosomal protein S11 [Patescibacteria group bacterium]MCL5114839.1 30S ribosomal protein S11 [Patescibacteria group bacterium]